MRENMTHRQQKFLYEYFDGSVLVKVWEVTGYMGKKFTARTIHLYKPSFK